MKLQLAFWRSLFALAVHASARFPRLVPTAVVEYVDRRFYAACLRETLRRVATESDLEAQRRSWAYGQVAMHDPNVTREMVDAVADTMPAPGEPWDALCGDGPQLEADAGAEHAARVDLHGADVWPSSRNGKGWVA